MGDISSRLLPIMQLLPVLVALAVTAPVLAQTLPLKTQSRWILDADDTRVKFRCINWAGHGEANIPEGLHKQSIDHIAEFIKDQGFNCVRLTYSIDHALNPDVTVKDSFTAAADAAGVDVGVFDDLYSRVAEKNAFVEDATTQDVFSAVISALWERQIMTILDNHVSKASWCCKWSLRPSFQGHSHDSLLLQVTSTTATVGGMKPLATLPLTANTSTPPNGSPGSKQWLPGPQLRPAWLLCLFETSCVRSLRSRIWTATTTGSTSSARAAHASTKRTPTFSSSSVARSLRRTSRSFASVTWTILDGLGSMYGRCMRTRSP